MIHPSNLNTVILAWFSGSCAVTLTIIMPWKKLLSCVTGQIDEALRRKLELVLEENRVHGELPWAKWNGCKTGGLE